MSIGYPIGPPISGANRGGTNPPSRPVPIPFLVASACGSWMDATDSKANSATREAFGFAATRIAARGIGC